MLTLTLVVESRVAVLLAAASIPAKAELP